MKQSGETTPHRVKGEVTEVLDVVEREWVMSGCPEVFLYNAINVSSQYVLMFLGFTQMSEGE